MTENFISIEVFIHFYFLWNLLLVSLFCVITTSNTPSHSYHTSNRYSVRPPARDHLGILRRQTSCDCQNVLSFC